MLKRDIEELILDALEVSPAILLSGPRQVGKSTLSMKHFKNYLLLDDITLRESAKEDSKAFIENQKKPLCIDEIQKVPELFEAIKIDIDKDRKNGNFLLTGSASVLDMKNIGDTLAGRIIEFSLWPLSSKEINSKDENIIDLLIKKDFKSIEKISTSKMIEYIINGGYPEAIKIKKEKLKHYWFASYISTYIERDVRDIGEIRNLSNFIKLFNLLAPRSANIFKVSELANSSGLSEVTVSNYLSLLEMVYQIKRVQPFSANFSKRFIKSPKMYFTDSGMLSHLFNIYSQEDFNNSQYKGEVTETYVFSELNKHLSYSSSNANLYHYRTNDKKEIDFILEYSNKQIAIEIKSSKRVTKNDFKHIIDFQRKSKNFEYGVVFYLGEEVLSFGKELYALPLSFFQ